MRYQIRRDARIVWRVRARTPYEAAEHFARRTIGFDATVWRHDGAWRQDGWFSAVLVDDESGQFFSAGEPFFVAREPREGR